MGIGALGGHLGPLERHLEALERHLGALACWAFQMLLSNFGGLGHSELLVFLEFLGWFAQISMKIKNLGSEIESV